MDLKRKAEIKDENDDIIRGSKCFRFDVRGRTPFRPGDKLKELGLDVLPPDEVVNSGRERKAAKMSQKGRSPLANVSNQTTAVAVAPVQAGTSAIPQADANLRKYISILNEERFFLYRRRSAKQNQAAEDYFERLSDEMILQIFRWLPKKALMRCSQVSKRFNQVSLDETLWTRLDLSCRSIREGALGTVISRGTVILRLAQAHVSYPVFLPDSFEPGFQTKLQFLDLSMCSIEPAALVELLSRCRSLRKLSLENVAVDASCCREIACNENLEALNLTMTTGLDSFGVTTLAKKLTKLHSLNISWTHLSRQAVEALVTHVNSSLLRLNVAGCRQTLNDAALEKLVSRCPDLLELDLSDCTQLTSEAITIVCKLKKLEYLSLSRCYNINVTSYLQLSDLHSLLFLDVFGLLSEQAINMLQTSFPGVGINKFIHSSVARPTVGTRRTSIWGLRTRD